MKMEIKWGEGSSDVLFDLEDNTLFSYKQAAEFLHETYGGKCYWKSCSGLSGRGYLEKTNSLIKLTPYRVDRGHYEYDKREKDVLPGRSLKVFAPIDETLSFRGDLPLVISNGIKIVFSTRHDLKKDIIDFYDADGGFSVDTENDNEIRELSVEYFNNNSKFTKTFWLKANGRRGVNALRFADFSGAISCAFHTKCEQYNFFQRRLNLYRIVGDDGCDGWLHLNRFSYFDRRWDENPARLRGEIVDGWVGDGDGFFWRRKGLEIECFVEMHSSEVSGGKWNTDRWVEYEAVFPAVEFFHRGENEIREWLIGRLREKAACIYLNPDDGKNITAETLSRFGDVELTVADARAAGCCLPGITQFRERNSLPMAVKLSDLSIDAKKLSEMLRDEDFRRTLAKKIESLTGAGDNNG